MSKFGFMTPSSAPATGGFSFGTNKPATPSFGLGASPSGGGLTFGAPATSAAPSFGTNFGAPAATSFGTTPGFGFGTATTNAPSTGLNFGTQPAAPAGGLNFGAPAAAPNTGLSFGAPVSTAPSGGLGGGLGGFNFGGNTATTAAPALNFFGTSLNNNPTSTANAGFGLNTTNPGLFDHCQMPSMNHPIYQAPANHPGNHLYPHPEPMHQSQYEQARNITFYANIPLPLDRGSYYTKPNAGEPMEESNFHSQIQQQQPLNTFQSTNSLHSNYQLVNHIKNNSSPQCLQSQSPCNGNKYQQCIQNQQICNSMSPLNCSTPVTNSGLQANQVNLSQNPSCLPSPLGNNSNQFPSFYCPATPPPSFIYGRPQNMIHLKTARPQYHFLSPSGKPAVTQSIDLSKSITTASLGLGGVDTASIGGVAGSSGAGAAGTQAGPAPRAAALPTELAATVDAFKASVRQRKQLSSDIARNSIRPLHKVQSEAEALLRECSELTADLAARRRTASGLRSRAASALPAAERAHRAAEAPHGVEYESGEAVSWITGVVAEGEARLRLLRRQLEAAQRQLGAPPRPVTDQELALGLRRIHESFVAIAGRLQAVHQLVEAQKTQYLSLRRNILKDPVDVFAEKPGSGAPLEWSGSRGTTSAVVADPLMALGLPQANKSQSTSGPNPFTYLGPPGFSGLPFGFSSKPQPAPAASQLSNQPWSLSSPPGLLAPGTSTGMGLAAPEGFALQKPPAGNKRGKH